MRLRATKLPPESLIVVLARQILRVFARRNRPQFHHYFLQGLQFSRQFLGNTFHAFCRRLARRKQNLAFLSREFFDVGDQLSRFPPPAFGIGLSVFVLLRSSFLFLFSHFYAQTNQYFFARGSTSWPLQGTAVPPTGARSVQGEDC